LESASGFTCDREFYVAFSPERVDPGNSHFNLRNTPKVVGADSEAALTRAVDFYSGLVDTVVAAHGTREAEAAKLLENTYRHVNIALLNEMSKFFHELNIDVWHTIDLASTKPFGFQAFYPGPGVGGHCIPIDPNYLSHHVRAQLGYGFRFVELAQEINAGMPAYVVRRAQEILNHDGLAVAGQNILLLGVTYKANISDQRESPATEVARAFLRLGARLSYHDPHVDSWIEGVQRRKDLVAAAASADLVILLQNHDEYEIEELVPGSRRFFDTRGVSRRGGGGWRL
jgi:nucleotide sugar dehydrogenase